MEKKKCGFQNASFGGYKNLLVPKICKIRLLVGENLHPIPLLGNTSQTRG